MSNWGNQAQQFGEISFSARSQLRYVERWPHPLHAVCFGDFRIHWLLAREIEEIFHLASWREPHQHPSRILTDVGPRMRYIPWREYGIAGPKREALIAYLDHDFVALNEVEPFFLCIVQMAHRPTLWNVAMLYQKETGLGVFGKDLEIQVRACARPMMLCPSRVRARRNKHWLPQRACNFGGRSKRRGKRQRHCYLQEITASDDSHGRDATPCPRDLHAYVLQFDGGPYIECDRDFSTVTERRLTMTA